MAVRFLLITGAGKTEAKVCLATALVGSADLKKSSVAPKKCNSINGLGHSVSGLIVFYFRPEYPGINLTVAA